MNQIVKVREEYADKLLAVVHVDGTSRIQTVYENTVIHDHLPCVRITIRNTFLPC